VGTIGALLAGAQFTVAPGVYTITEIKSPVGYKLNDPVQTVEVLANGGVVCVSSNSNVSGNNVTFENKKLNIIVILKLDAITHAPLQGATFKIERDNGEKTAHTRPIMQIKF
jgi:uncharacterized surface anchored protein